MKKKVLSALLLVMFLLATFVSLSVARVVHPCDKYLGPEQIENGDGCANQGGNCCW